MIVDLAESILNLCRAASASYSLVEDPTGPADDNFNLAAWSCSKSPMSLGNLILEDAEKTLLARHIVYVVLTGLSALLRSVYAWTGAEGRKVPTGGTGNTNLGVEVPPSLYGREVDKQVSLTLSRVLALLGKLFPA